jgi:hypothetical protein
MTNKVDYKKIRTDIINGKKRCIYMKPKGKREYVKSGGEFVSLSAYIKTLQKKNKKKGGGDGDEGEYYPVPDNSPVNSPRNYSTTPQLPEGWTKQMSTTKGHPYYRNNATGETTWNHPSSMVKRVPSNMTKITGPNFSTVLKKTGEMQKLL